MDLDSPSGRSDTAAWSTGHGNFGIAHGIAGPIALIALSARAGHSVAGQHQTLTQCCRLLEERAHCLPSGATAWPETLTLDGWIRSAVFLPAPSEDPLFVEPSPGYAASRACGSAGARSCPQAAVSTDCGRWE